MLKEIFVWCLVYKILDEIILEAIIKKLGEYLGKMSGLKGSRTKKG